MAGIVALAGPLYGTFAGNAFLAMIIPVLLALAALGFYRWISRP
jgi:hypothetical protein